MSILPPPTAVSDVPKEKDPLGSDNVIAVFIVEVVARLNINLLMHDGIWMMKIVFIEN